MGVAKGSQLRSPKRIRDKMIRKQPKVTTVATRTKHEDVGVELQASLERERTLQARITTLSQRATAAKERATTAEEKATTAEERATTAQERPTTAEERATTAEERATTAEEMVRRVIDSEHRAREAQRMAEDRATAAEVTVRRVTESEHRAREAERMAEERATTVEKRVAQSEHRIREAERVAEEANRRAQEAEQRAAEAERRLEIENQPFWAVDREEIVLTGEKLGEGGWAEVKVAKFRGARVAAKCLYSQIISDYNRDLFIREMNVAARVRHPNLLLFIGATLQGELTILTELMSTSLRALLEQGELPQQQLIAIACDITKALNYLHLMRPDPIIHRDVSSANVLLDQGHGNSWRAKVSDYGSANFLRQLSTAGPGNPTYAAPEANIASLQSNKMDIFSFGVLLVEMCTARFPDPTSRERLIRSIREPRLLGLVRQCTAVDKDMRPSAADLITRLTEL